MKTRLIKKIGRMVRLPEGCKYIPREAALKFYYCFVDKLIFYIAKMNKAPLSKFGTFEIHYTAKRPYKMPDGTTKIYGDNMRISFTPAKHFYDTIKKLRDENNWHFH